MANRSFPYTPELKSFQDADDAWGAMLRRVFGKRSAEARYTSLGKGEEGSELRRLYEARTAAQSAWHASAY
jgi:hypothetical protein